MADLGDGNGARTSLSSFKTPIKRERLTGNETAVIRYDYNDPSLGTCQESVQGGNHFRYWVQNGSGGKR